MTIILTLNVADEYDSEESFSERAIRIRLGKRMDSCGSSFDAEFCLGDPVRKAEIVQKVVLALKQPELVANKPLARDNVYATLRKNYPCEPSN